MSNRLKTVVVNYNLVDGNADLTDFAIKKDSPGPLALAVFNNGNDVDITYTLLFSPNGVDFRPIQFQDGTEITATAEVSAVKDMNVILVNFIVGGGFFAIRLNANSATEGVIEKIELLSE